MENATRPMTAHELHELRAYLADPENDFVDSFSDQSVRRIVAALDSEATALNAKLNELHAIAAAHIPKPPSPEARAKIEARLRAVPPERALANIQKALNMREVLSAEEHTDLEGLWDKWADENDPHEKAKLQMALGETVASWMSHAEALEREIEEWRIGARKRSDER
jgi:hypothetical protein